MDGAMILIFLVLWPAIGSLFVWFLGGKNKKSVAVMAGGIAVTEFLLVLLAVWKFSMSGILEFQIPQICMRGLFFRLDGFRLLMILTAAFMWMMTGLFSIEYMDHGHQQKRYYLFVLVTLSAVMGIFLSYDLFTTFIFFEIMSFTSYVWVAQEETKEAMRAAETYLAVAVIGGLTMLMGLFMLYHLTGTLQMDLLAELAGQVENKALLYWSGALILVGFGAKAGMFPLHIWLPKAHPIAPAPASALLSGMLTKTGIFGILIISTNLFWHDGIWGFAVLILGVVTMFLGAALALFSINLKRTLALSSMSQIGFILVGVGMMGLLSEEHELAVRGLVLHMMNHSLIKLVLFMAAGVVAMNLHALDLNEIRGFGKGKPLLHACFLMGALGIGGIPLWNGYISKTLLHESIVEYSAHLLHNGSVNASLLFTGIEWVFLLTGGLTVAYMTKLYIALFQESNPQKQKDFDSRNCRYMTKLSSFVLGASAVILPVLGFLPYITMDNIAGLVSGFFQMDSHLHRVNYFSLVNLKGAVISIVIGAAVYLLVIRKWLMAEDENGVRVYVNRWPVWLDLEEELYRPVFLLFLPAISLFFCEIWNRLLDGFLMVAIPFSAFVCRCLDYLLDTLVAIGARTVWRDVRPKQPVVVGSRFTFMAGKFWDKVRKTSGEESYVYEFARRREVMRHTGRMVGASMSFGLLLVCIGLFLTLGYLLIH